MINPLEQPSLEKSETDDTHTRIGVLREVKNTFHMCGHLRWIVVLRRTGQNCFLIESMPNRLLHLILVGVALSHELNGSYFLAVSEPYLDLVYTFSDNAKIVDVSFYCGVGPRPTRATFVVEKVSDVRYRIPPLPNHHWIEFIKSFKARCEDYLPVKRGDLWDIKYDTKFDHPSIHLKGKWWRLAHREPPSH